VLPHLPGVETRAVRVHVPTSLRVAGRAIGLLMAAGAGREIPPGGLAVLEQPERLRGVKGHGALWARRDAHVDVTGAAERLGAVALGAVHQPAVRVGRVPCHEVRRMELARRPAGMARDTEDLWSMTSRAVHLVARRRGSVQEGEAPGVHTGDVHHADTRCASRRGVGQLRDHARRLRPDVTGLAARS